MTTVANATVQPNPANAGAAGSSANEELESLRKENATMKAHVAGRDKHNSRLEKEVGDLKAQMNASQPNTSGHGITDTFTDELGELADPITKLINSQLQNFQDGLAPMFDGLQQSIKDLGAQTGTTNETIFRSALTQQLIGFEAQSESDEFKNFLDTPIKFGGGQSYRDKWDEALANKNSDLASSMWNEFHTAHKGLFVNSKTPSIIEPDTSRVNGQPSPDDGSKKYTPEDLTAMRQKLQTGQIDPMAFKDWKEKTYDPNKSEE